MLRMGMLRMTTRGPSPLGGIPPEPLASSSVIATLEITNSTQIDLIFIHSLHGIRPRDTP